MCAVAESLFDEEEAQELDAKDLKVRTIRPGLKVLSLFINLHYQTTGGYIIVAFENPTYNLIDFNRLFIEDIDDDDNWKFRYTQYREVVPRASGWQKDPIKKCCFRFSDDFNYTCVLRESGNVDFYWNMMLTETTHFTDKRVLDIDMACGSFFFMVEQQVQNLDKTMTTVTKMLGFDHKNKASASFGEAEDIDQDDLQWRDLELKKVKSTVQLYSDFKFFQQEIDETYVDCLAVSHGKYVSLMRLDTWAWIDHICFETEVLCLFYWTSYFSVMTKDGKIFRDFYSIDNREEASTTIEGEIL